MTKKSFLIFVILFKTIAFSAPHPGTGSSLITNPEKGLFFGNQGFRLGTSNSKWILNSLDSDNQIRYSSLESDTASAMIKTDDLSAPLNLDAYAKKWMKDYYSYEFTVLGTRTFIENQARGMVVDLMSKGKDKQIRQVIYLKNKKAVIITCSDKAESFLSTLPQCNQLIKNFSWLNSVGPTVQKEF